WRQRPRAQQPFQGAGSVFMGADDRHGDDYVGGDQVGRRPTAVGVGEGKGDVIAVHRAVFYRKERGFSDLDLTLYARTELSGKWKSEGGTSLTDRVEATLGIIMHMATLAIDEHTRMRQEALHRVETEWGRQFQNIKE
ncbi:unnamed protein product, partial [Laminaria digitata]